MLPAKIIKSMERRLHVDEDHPVCIIKQLIYRHFPSFSKFDQFSPIVSVEDNFDKLLVPFDHPSRNPSDTFYLQNNRVMRTHMTAHQCHLLSKGYSSFLVTGDVYRRDSIDRFHYPVFHQMDGVNLCSKPQLILEQTVICIIKDLFPDCEYRQTETYFPFTHPSFEYEVKFRGEWLEVLGCGIIKNEIIKNCGLDGEEGWAFGIGLDRLAMVLFEIPDIRLLWSEDERFTSQFKRGRINKFVPFSNQPSCYKDISFWISDKFTETKFCELIREIAGDVVENVICIDRFTRDDERSFCYRINYRSIDRTLTNEEIDVIQEKIRKAVVDDLNVVIR